MQVSVIVPVHNTTKRFLEPCLDSIATQTVPCDVILVNDGSDNPDTSEVLENYANQHGWKLVKHRRNRGVAVARNTGLKYVHTDYVAICDSDDYWAPQKLEKQLKAIGANHACICGVQIDYRNAADYPWQLKPAYPGLNKLNNLVSYGVVSDGANRYHVVASAHFDDEQQVAPAHLMSLLGADTGGFSVKPVRATYARLIRFNASLCGSNTLFRTRTLKQFGFKHQLNGADEWDALLNCAALGDVAIVNQPLCSYVRRMYSYSATHLAHLRSVCEDIIYKHRKQLTDEERVVLQSVETAEWAAEFEKSTFLARTPYKLIQYSG